MEKQNIKNKTFVKDNIVPTEMGSAHFVSLDHKGNTYNDEIKSNSYHQNFSGPPWSLEPSMKAVCDEAGIDYNMFVTSLSANKSDLEMAQEFNLSEKTISGLRERYFNVEAITGNYGQD
ncbi:MAG: hypothetical protein PHI90_03230 [Clostridia bacterium]|nr:hypothetical protein [Clostridia bacterium]MDD4047830.1 hypothetical protein [Clostridia bacterium]